MNDTLTVVIVEPSVEQFSFVAKCLPAWECLNTPLDAVGNVFSSGTNKPKLIILYARRNWQNTESICTYLRKVIELSNVPLLLVISRYQMNQAHAVKGLANTNYIIAPFKAEELQDIIVELMQ